MNKIFFLLLFLISFSTSAHDSGRVHEVENQIAISSTADESQHTHLSFDGIFESDSFSFYTSGSQSFSLESDGDVRVHNLGSGVVKSDGVGVLSFEAIKTGFNKDFGTTSGTVAEGDHGHIHSGQVTGAIGSMLLDKTSITDQTFTSASNTDLLLFSDSSDSNNLKKATIFDVVDSAIGDDDFADYYATGSTSINTTSTTIAFHVTRQQTSGFTRVGDLVTVNTAGDYVVHFDINLDDSSDDNHVASCWIEVNSTEVSGTRSRIYHDDNDEASGISGSAILTLSASDIVRLRCRVIMGSSGLNTLASGTRLSFHSVGSNGKNGIDGADGAQGPQGIQGPAGSGSSINIQEGGAYVSGTPFETLNFIGANVVASGSSTADITIESTFGSEAQRAVSNGESSTTSTAFQQKLRLTTSNLPSGTYRVGIRFQFRVSNDQYRFKAQAQLNDSTTFFDFYKRARADDSLDKETVFFPDYISLSGVNNIDLDYSIATSGGTAYIRNAMIELWRVD